MRLYCNSKAYGKSSQSFKNVARLISVWSNFSFSCSLSLSFSPCLYLSYSLHLSLPLSPLPSLYRFPSLFPCLSLSLSTSGSVGFSLSLALSPSISFSLSASLSPSLSVYLSSDTHGKVAQPTCFYNRCAHFCSRTRTWNWKLFETPSFSAGCRGWHSGQPRGGRWKCEAEKKTGQLMFNQAPRESTSQWQSCVALLSRYNGQTLASSFLLPGPLLFFSSSFVRLQKENEVISGRSCLMDWESHGKPGSDNHFVLHRKLSSTTVPDVFFVVVVVFLINTLLSKFIAMWFTPCDSASEKK